MSFLSWLPFGHVPETSAEGLSAALRRDPPPQLVDVRTPAEFAAGHLEGAVNVPVGSLSARLDSLRLDTRRPVVAICLSAHRSAPAVRMLRQAGFDAAHLAGGMNAWRAAGLPEVRG
ncbi:MAG TPA: rhodanese-like domain-containing protein [Anaeromyxobacteraceae bacterium]|jgi:rhodanese-related sulfurtransferase|nr:rhodanese-like domain-containing protein [Anaeromyxobacteraceae bacterium]